ncbi:MAG: hypothetical protein QW597_07005 [Thermoplasmataceae archaeon]
MGNNRETLVITVCLVLAAVISVLMLNYPRLFSILDMIVAVSIILVIMAIIHYTSRN